MTRVTLFNIVTQHKALFDDDYGKESHSKLHLVFNSWIHEKIDDFLRMVENDLLQCNSNSLQDIGSLLGQCMYFGVSFSRIGIDFRAQVAPIFLKAITKHLNMSVIKCTRQLEFDMEHFTLINKDILTHKRHQRAGDVTEKSSNSPPECLLNWTPLAVYCNGLLNIFNELRVCSPTAVIHPFIMALETSLETVAKALLSLYRSEQQAFGLKEKENFQKLCSCFCYELLPYIQNCLNLIFPPCNKIVHNVENFTTMRNDKILEPIMHLIPDH